MIVTIDKLSGISKSLPHPNLVAAFLAVAEGLHFGRAARRLGVTQPRLSQRIKKLENELGFRLFDRGSRHVALTPAGSLLQQALLRIRRDWTEGAAAARNVARGATGQLRIGYVVPAILQFLPRVVRAYQTLQPRVQLLLRELSTAPQLEALRRHEIDVGFVSDPPSGQEWVAIPLWSEPFLVAVSDDHWLAQRDDAVELSDLKRERHIIFPREQAPALYDKLLRALAKITPQPRLGQEAQSWHMIVSLVGAKLGVALVPESVRQLTTADVELLSLRDAPTVTLTMCRSSDTPSPLVERFEEVCLQHASSYSRTVGSSRGG